MIGHLHFEVKPFYIHDTEANLNFTVLELHFISDKVEYLNVI